VTLPRHYLNWMGAIPNSQVWWGLKLLVYGALSC
jgi:hypothetical protein